MGRLEVTVRQRRPVEGLRQEGLVPSCETEVISDEEFTVFTECVWYDLMIRVLMEMSGLCSNGARQLVVNIEGLEQGPEDTDIAGVSSGDGTPHGMLCVEGFFRDLFRLLLVHPFPFPPSPSPNFLITSVT